MIKLKDCPFCGGKAIRVQHPGTNWDGSEGKYVNIGALHGAWYVNYHAINGGGFLFQRIRT